MKLIAATLLLLSFPAVAQQTTWRFDNLHQIGGVGVTTVGAPKVIDTPVGKAVHFEGSGPIKGADGGHAEGDALFVNTAPLAGDATYTFEVVFRPSSTGAKAQRFFHQQDKDSQSRRMFEMRIVDGKWCLDTVGIDTGRAAGADPQGSAAQHGVTMVCDAAHLHPLDRWYAVAATYDGKMLRGYVNGELQGEVAATLTPLPAGTTSIGTRIDKRDFFTGDVYSARFSSNVLPATEFLKAPAAH
jgi:hypothetical protein